jgi:hypothetical protein
VLAFRIDALQRPNDRGCFKRFSTYWYDEAAKQWNLFAECEKFKYDQLGEFLQIQIFMEVVGGRSGERSGHLLRKNEYQAWERKAATKMWNFADQMVVRSSRSIDNKQWTCENNRFCVSTGGILSQKTSKANVKCAKPAELPEFMQLIHQIDQLDTQYPEIVSWTSPADSNQVLLDISLPAQMDWPTCQLVVYSSLEDCLTYTTKWQHSRIVDLSSLDVTTMPDQSRRVQLAIDRLDTPQDDFGTYVMVCARDAAKQLFAVETLCIN